MSPETIALLQLIGSTVPTVLTLLFLFRGSHRKQNLENKKLALENEKLELELKNLKGEKVSETDIKPEKTKSLAKYYVGLVFAFVLLTIVMINQVFLLIDPDPLTRWEAFQISANVVYFFLILAGTGRLAREIKDRREYTKIRTSDIENLKRFIDESKIKQDEEFAKIENQSNKKSLDTPKEIE